MGLIEKAKDTLTKATETAKDKFDDVLDRRKADELFHDIGLLVYRQRTDRATEHADDDIARLVAELNALEAEGFDIDDAEGPA